MVIHENILVTPNILSGVVEIFDVRNVSCDKKARQSSKVNISCSKLTKIKSCCDRLPL